MDVRHITESGTVEFNGIYTKYLVKNFGEKDIKVALGEEITDNNYVTIPSNCFEVISSSNARNTGGHAQGKVTVEGSGNIEIRAVE